MIDAHTHIMPPEWHAPKMRARLCAADRWFEVCYADPKARMVTAEALIGALDAAGIAQAVVCGFAFADPALCRESNDYIIDAVHRYPQRLIGLGAIQPTGSGAAQEAERCLDAGLSGLGELLPDGQGWQIAAAAGQEPFAAVADLLIARNVPLMLHASEPVGHLYGGKGETTPDKILAFAQRFPDLKIVAAHWGGGLPFYELMPEVRAALANVAYDSAASTYLYRFDIFRAVVAAAGSHKILFATDYPLLNPTKFLARLRDAGLSDDEWMAITGGNAARIYKNIALIP